MKDRTTCENCRYWNAIAGIAGECRRSPPVVVHTGLTTENEDPMTFWPETEAHSWCGQAEAADPMAEPTNPLPPKIEHQGMS